MIIKDKKLSSEVRIVRKAQEVTEISEMEGYWRHTLFRLSEFVVIWHFDILVTLFHADTSLYLLFLQSSNQILILNEFNMKCIYE